MLWRHSVTRLGGILDGREINSGVLSDTRQRMTIDEESYSRLMSGFSDLQNDHALLVGWHDLMLASKKLPIEAQVFQSWYFALYPEKLGSEADVSRDETLFPGLRDLSRSGQKEALRNAIELSDRIRP